ncbi:hypothetical protein [Ktedonospora formicarum]|uniref:Uncharacterized protein n=1 Tax=Ktedonospora formicarum TaxID=2778364 RepID=A0A8J3HYN6_9CHLR|nr:hypothetical protein [Ktedonospora formicarum]GHO43433.1 hypothetical protein KSX_15960 [Ktedonospora formicarum]
MTLLSFPLSDLVIMTGDVLGYHIQITIGTLIVWSLALIISLVAEFLVGWRLPYGILGAFITGLLGIWLTTEVWHFTLPLDFVFHDIPLLKAFVGVLALVTLWHLITFPLWRKRSQRSRRLASAR